MPRTILLKHDPTSTALAVIDSFVTKLKDRAAEIQYGFVSMGCTIHAGRIVRVDLGEQIKTDVTL